jgi:hypothetical protein
MRISTAGTSEGPVTHIRYTIPPLVKYTGGRLGFVEGLNSRRRGGGIVEVISQQNNSRKGRGCGGVVSEF